MPLIKNRIQGFSGERPAQGLTVWPEITCEEPGVQHRRRSQIAQDWETLMPRAMAKFTQAFLAKRIETLEKTITYMADRIHVLGTARSIVVPVESFAPEPFEAIKPFHVVIEPVDDEFIASLYDANINASGENEEEAVANLKDMMLTLLERLQREPEHNFGVGPTRQLAVLKSLIRKLS